MRFFEQPAKLLAIVVTLTIIGCTVANQNKTIRYKTQLGRFQKVKPNNKIPLKDRIDLAWAQERQMTQDPALGYVPKERLIPAWDYTKTKIASARSTAAISNINWVEVGPKNCGGRSRAVLVDANDPTGKTVFVGSVGGGVWKTTDITQAEPNWQVVNDFFGNIAITSIAQDPSNSQIMYFSTGEGYGNIDAIRGLGVWKSTNGGSTWTYLAATNNANFYYCQKVLVSSTGVLYVATSSGLQRSADGGSSFTKVLGTGLGITGATNNFCYDVEIAANGHVYSSIAGTLHKSTNSGVTFGANLPIGITASRIEVAVAPNDANYVYVLCESGSAVSGIALSTNAGTSFTAKTEPADADPGIPATDFSRSQAWYDLTIEVDPNNRDVIFVGGIDLFKSSNGGTSWQQVSHWYGGFGFQNVHADQHNIIFSPGSSSIAYFVNDGGIYRTANATASIPTISVKEINYNTTQFYGAAMSPTALSFDFLAGAQDNGSHKLSQSVIHNSTEVTGGDGAFCHIDQDQPQFWFSSYVFNDYFRSTNGGSSFTSITVNGNGLFINPTDYDDVANMMYCSNSSNTYLRWNDPQTGASFTSISATAFNGQASAIKVSPNTANRVFFGTTSGRVVRADNANAAIPTFTNISTGLPAGYVSCVEVQTGNDNHILVTYTNYGLTSIWETTNGGTSWTQVEGNLPDMPVRWALFNPNNSDQAVIATELGVWSTDDLNGASTNWGASNTGLANVRVDMLQIRSSDKLMIAATHGRGLFYSSVFSPSTALFEASTLVAYQGRQVQFTNTSFNATSSAWNFGDGDVSTATNPIKKFNTSGTFNVTLTINGGASSVVKSITVLPKLGTPYLIANGGNFEINTGNFASQTVAGTAWQRGNSAVTGKNGVNSGSSAWVTGLTGNYADNTESYLYTPNYNLSAVGSYDFSFYTKFFTESGYDGFRVEYSLDSGKVWQPLGTTTQAGWYNFANTNGDAAFPVNQAFFSGSLASFGKFNYNISSLAGNSNVAFRFAFKSDITVNAAGVAIDDVEVTGPANAPTPTWNGTVWSGGTPTATTDAIIASSTVPTATFSCRNLTINSGVSLNTTGITANVNGDIINNGNGISGTGTLNIAANSSISGNNLAVTGVLTVAAGATLTTNNLLTLKSTSITNTATIGNSTGTISGNVTIERYIPAKRAFRLLATGVTTSTTIRENWQEAQNNMNTSSNSNSNIGFGTHITGSTNGSNGFDATSTGSPSLFTFNNNTAAWSSIANTNGLVLNNLTPYRLLIRGSRAVNLNNNNATPDNTVLRASGTINNTSSTTFNSSSIPTALTTNTTVNQNFSLIPNPYWSAINWATITKNNIGGSYFIWDANMGARGAYTSWNGSVGSAGAINQFIQPGQAFFVTTTGINPSLTITQADKVNNLTATFRQNQDFAKLAITLQYNNTFGETITADGATAILGNYKKTIEADEDALKLNNLDEMLSINRNGTLLSIEARPLLASDNDTLQLQLTQYTQTNYKLVVNASNFNLLNQLAFVVDSYLNKTYPLNLSGETYIPVVLNAEPLSKAPNRFYIVLTNTNQLAASGQLQFSINPNPAKGKFILSYIQPYEQNITLQISNIEGKKLQTIGLGKLKNAQQTISINTLKPGTYIIQLSNDSETKTEKLVVQ